MGSLPCPPLLVSGFTPISTGTIYTIFWENGGPVAVQLRHILGNHSSRVYQALMTPVILYAEFLFRLHLERTIQFSPSSNLQGVYIKMQQLLLFTDYYYSPYMSLYNWVRFHPQKHHNNNNNHNRGGAFLLLLIWRFQSTWFHAVRR